MIQEGDEYQIYFTRDDIRECLSHEDLTDEQCDAIAEEIAGLFNDEFYYNVRNAEV
jgi:hypothetical protein